MSQRHKTPDGYPLAPSPVTIMDGAGRVIARVEPGTRERIDAQTGKRSNMFPAKTREVHRAYPPSVEHEKTLNSFVPIRRKGLKRD